MQRALALAAEAGEAGDVPVGAVLVHQGRILAEAGNQTFRLNDPTAHAEVQVLRLGAAHLATPRLVGTCLYVTLEPCVMCVGAMIHARIARLVYAAREPRTGAVVSNFDLLMRDRHNHRVAVTEGVLADDSSRLLKSFFRSRR